MTSANVGFNFDRGRVSLNYVRALNEMNSFASIQGSGIIPIPRNMRWIDSRRNILRGFVGPQAQNTYGIALNYQLSRTIAFEGEAAQTEYNPDTSKINFNTTATGSLAQAGLKGNFDDRLKLALNYFSISATYDPFLLRYQLPPNLPVFLPYATYYSNYWQLHDSQNYPSNRQGLSFNGSYRWVDTELTGSWGTQEQVAASTPSQIQTPGNVEPLFTTLRGGGSEKGKINNWGLGLTHTFPCKLGAALSYYNYDISRPSNFRLDSMSFNENIYYGGLTYPLDTRTNLFGNYTVVSLKGNTGVTMQDFRQDIPAVGASYSLGEKSFISLSYRFFHLSDYATSNSNWHANQTMMEYKVSF